MPILLGPPAIRHRNAATPAAVSPLSSNTEDLPFYGSWRRGHRMGFTENNSLTYLATDDPCLDFFFHVVPDTPPEDLTRRLKEAWDHDPLTTLKLVCHLPGVRGTGKSDKERFYTAALWLHKHHPQTLARNIGVVEDFGYFKDLPELLYRLVDGLEARNAAKAEWRRRKSEIKSRSMERQVRKIRAKIEAISRKREKELLKNKRFQSSKLRGEYRAAMRGVSRSPSPIRPPKEQRVRENLAKIEAARESAKASRLERAAAKATKALDMYKRDLYYQFLHDQISDLFSDILKSDIQHLNAGELKKITLASKWCPSIDSCYDKFTLLCESIAQKIFPKDAFLEYREIEQTHYVYRVRDRLRKEILVPLRKALELPEVYMSANQWESLPYNRLASVAMKKYKGVFKKHDDKRFEEYLDDVKRGEATIAGGALLPHDIIQSLNDENDGGKVAELQWARMVDDLAKQGKLSNCIAVCDVSGSMTGTPMEVSVALGILISELSKDPWKGNVITFSGNPQLHKVKGDNFLEKTQFVRLMDWGGNTDFHKVFVRILEVAVDGGLTEDQMIKRVFVFSDMEFDEARSGHGSFVYRGYGRRGYGYGEGTEEFGKHGWETDYEVIERKYKEKGFNKVPEIVFWNLRNSSATTVAADQKGVALVGGFSKNLVKVFLKEGGIINPVAVMHDAISGELYQKLVVFD